MPAPEPTPEAPLERLGRLIVEAREDLGWTQERLAQEAHVSRPTVQRYENAKVAAPEFEKVRSIVLALNVDPREIPVALGLVTREEMGLPPERIRPPRHDATTAEILDMVVDPRYPHSEKQALRDLLRARLGTGEPPAEAV